jgi:hypothetical protein
MALVPTAEAKLTSVRGNGPSEGVTAQRVLKRSKKKAKKKKKSRRKSK